MRILVLFALAFCVCCCSAKPVSDEFIFSQEDIQDLLDTMKNHGQRIAMKALQQMLESAKGAFKEILQELIKKLEDGGEDSAYFLDQLIDQERIQEILTDLLEHGKKVGINTLKKMLELAKGSVKDMLQKMIDQLSGTEESNEAYIIDSNIDREKLKELLNELREHGRNISRKTLLRLISISKGRLRQFLEKLLERIEGKGTEAYFISKEDIQDLLETLKGHGEKLKLEAMQNLLKVLKGQARELVKRLIQMLEEGENPEAYFIDELIDTEEMKRILNEILDHGKRVGQNTLLKLISIAKGAAKDMLLKVLENLEEKEAEAFSMRPYFIDQIIDVEQLKQALNDLLDHGKRIGKSTLEKLLRIAKGSAKDMLLKLLEQLAEKEAEEAFVLDQLGINKEKIQNILEELREHGKNVGLKLLRQALETAKGAFKEMLQKIVDSLTTEQQVDAYIWDQLGIDQEKIKEVLEALHEHGKRVAIDMLKKFLDTAKGAFKEILQKILDSLSGSSTDAYIIDQLVDQEKIQQVLQDLLEHGKRVGIETLKKLLALAKGSAKEMLQKIIDSLAAGQLDAYIVDKDNVNDILESLKNKGQEAALQQMRELLKHLKGQLRELVKKLINYLEEEEEPQAYFIDQIIDPEKLKQTLLDLLEHGKRISLQTLEKLISIAKGSLKEWLEQLVLKLAEKEIENQIAF